MSDEPGETWKRPSQYSPRNSGANSNRRKPEPQADDAQSGKYPPLFSPAWHALRQKVLCDIADQQRRLGAVALMTSAQRRTAKLAFDLASLERGMIGYPEAIKAHQDDAAAYLTCQEHALRSDMTPEQLLALWRANGAKPMKPAVEMAESEYVF